MMMILAALDRGILWFSLPGALAMTLFYCAAFETGFL